MPCGDAWLRSLPGTSRSLRGVHRLELAPEGDDRVTAAVGSAVSHAGVELAPQDLPGRAAWWRAGVAEAVGRDPTAVRPPGHYDVAPSPRNSRGATRA